MNTIKIKFNFKKVTSWVLTLFMAFSLVAFINPYSEVSAKTVSSTPATEFTVNIVENGQTTLVHQYTIDEMKSLETSEPIYYSSIDSMPAPVGTKAQGVLLSTLLNDLKGYNSDVANYSAIKFFATDTSGNPYTTIQKSYLYGDPRYYCPNLISTWDGVNNKPGSGAFTGAVAVEPMFAIDSYQGRYLTQSQLDSNTMDEINMFRFCFGQTQADVTNGTTTTNKFVRWVNRIDIVIS